MATSQRGNKPIPNRTDTEIAWLAGLLEGEGCFWHGNSGRILIRLAMTDHDIIERAAALMDAFVENPRMPHARATKVVYACRARGELALEWMRRLRPFMGIRRRAKIDECLAYAASRPGKRFNSCGGRTKPLRGKMASLSLEGTSNVACNGQLSLVEAQQRIAANWQTADR